MYKLKLIPYYIDKEDLNDVLRDERGKKLLWLEILFNNSIEWELLYNIDEIKDAYEKACIWYSNFKGLIEKIAEYLSGRCLILSGGCGDI